MTRVVNRLNLTRADGATNIEHLVPFVLTALWCPDHGDVEVTVEAVERAVEQARRMGKVRYAEARPAE